MKGKNSRGEQGRAAGNTNRKKSNRKQDRAAALELRENSIANKRKQSKREKEDRAKAWQTKKKRETRQSCIDYKEKRELRGT